MANHKELLSTLSKQEYYLKKIYSSLSIDLSKVLRKYKVNNNSKLWFKNEQVKKEVETVLAKYRTKIESHIVSNIRDSWELSNRHNDQFVKNYIQGITIPNDKLYFQRNNIALESFLKRQSNGLNLSKRVWNLTNTTKAQLEYFIADGLTEGRSAANLAKDLQRYLINPDKRFRRVRSKVTGKLIISDPASNFNPGTGVYRSSYKNALRLARNEINIAYRTADFERRKQLPFVLGVRVNLSPAHPRYDICDELVGEYPKGFQFTGWHPNCLCYTTNMLMSHKDFKKYLSTGSVDSKKLIKSIPNQANEYLYHKSKNIKKLSSKPYFIADNFTFDSGTYKLKKSIGIHIPYVPIPDLRSELIGYAGKFKSDYEIIFNQENETRRNMMNNFLNQAKELKEEKLILEQKASVYGYTTNRIYEDLNKLLRGTKEFSRNKSYTEFLTAYGNVLDESLSKLPSFKGNVFRGTRLSDDIIDRYRKAFKNNKIITETFFQSTSIRRDGAFSGNVRFLIKSKTGKRIEHLSRFGKSESEVLMLRNTRYRIKNLIEIDGITEIEMEEI